MYNLCIIYSPYSERVHNDVNALLSIKHAIIYVTHI